MSEPIVERLGNFMKYKRLNQAQLAKELGYNSSEKISRLFREEGAKPSSDIICDISRRFDELNKEWWLTGRGNMLNTPLAESALYGAVLEEGTGELADELASLNAIENSSLPDSEKIKLLQRLVRRYQFEIRLLREEILLREDLQKIREVKKEA
jgi:transcriptional regulator with XRE-family HTH domain